MVFLGFIGFQGPMTNDHDRRFLKALIGRMMVSLWIMQGQWSDHGKACQKNEWESDMESYTFKNG